MIVYYTYACVEFSIYICFHSFNLTIRAIYTGRGLSGQLGMSRYSQCMGL